MRSFQCTRVLLIGLIFSAHTAAWADDLEPKALTALEQMGGYLRSLQQFRIDAHSHTDQVLDNGQTIEFSHQTHLVAMQPDKLQVSVESDGERRSLFYNGKSFTLYDSAQLDVTTQSARALTAADVLAYTTTVRSGCLSQKAENSSTGQPRSREHVASSVGINTRFSGVRIFAVSPMKRTPATRMVLAGWAAPKRAISRESDTQPPVSSARA